MKLHTLATLGLLASVCISCDTPDLHRPQNDWPQAKTLKGREDSAKGPFVLDRPIRLEVSTKHFQTKSVLFTKHDKLIKAIIAVACESDPRTSRQIKVLLYDSGGNLVKQADFLYTAIGTIIGAPMIWIEEITFDIGQWADVKDTKQFSIEVKVVKKTNPNHASEAIAPQGGAQPQR